MKKGTEVNATLYFILKLLNNYFKILQNIKHTKNGSGQLLLLKPKKIFWYVRNGHGVQRKIAKSTLVLENILTKENALYNK